MSLAEGKYLINKRNKLSGALGEQQERICKLENDLDQAVLETARIVDLLQAARQERVALQVAIESIDVQRRRLERNRR